ncbi:MAG: MFS transporter [Proteobacteria bacterium]|jgi:Arabinose efflux permease|nr:MAG: MFS transporter [Pseudomonadota bacterium]
MAGLLRPVTALLIAAAILLMGNGLLNVLIPVRADVEHFSRLAIGLLGSAYYAGLVLGCFFAPKVIARVGHIRAFVAFTAIATITPLLHAILTEPFFWSALRALNGFCFAGLFMGIESWLCGASTMETRGRVLASYTVVNLTVVTLGMQMMGLGTPGSFELFSLVAILYSLAAVPVALTRTSAPTPPATAKLRLGWLINVSPAAVAGCFFTGVANGAFWSLAPLYGRSAGLSLTEVAMFMTLAVLGGAASQWPVGYLSDRVGRRPLLVTVGIVGAAAGIALYVLSTSSPWAIFPFAVLYGCCAFPIYTLCVAHANDLVHKKRAVEVSSGLLLTFSIGAVIGPLVAGYLMSIAGHGALFLHSALAHLLIAVVMVVRVKLRPKLPAERKENFIVVPKTTPAVFELDPRAEGVSVAEPAGDCESDPAPANP